MKQGHRRMIENGQLAVLVALFAAMQALPSCVYDRYDNVGPDNTTVGVELSIVTRAVDEHEGYEIGAEYENYIDIAGGDYKIYFFTNDKDDASATDDSGRNTLIAEFVPTDLTAVEGSSYTQYTLSGKVGDDVAAYSSFKVVVLANWGTYPSVTAGTTTIDALVEGNNTTFSAETFLSGVDADHLIPFYGVREYSNVEWRQGWRTTLSGDITLLRAVAKVEVVMSEDSDIDSFDDVSIVSYNTSGYCAPAGVYLRADYDHDYSWDNDFTDNVHLVGGRNSDNNGTAPLSRQSATGSDVWTIYLPEYDNMDTDFCYITVKFDYQTADEEPYKIYFADYTDGTTSAYDGTGTDDRYDILRNHLYRFTVSISGTVIQVHVDKWEDTHDNDFVFDIEPEYQ